MIRTFRGRIQEQKHKPQKCVIFLISIIICTGITLCEQVSADVAGEMSSGSVSSIDTGLVVSTETLSTEPNSIPACCNPGSIDTDFIQHTTQPDTSDCTEITQEDLFMSSSVYDTDEPSANVASGVSHYSENVADVTVLHTLDEQLSYQDDSYQTDSKDDDLNMESVSGSGSKDMYPTDTCIQDNHPEETELLLDNEEISTESAVISDADATNLPYIARIIPVTENTYSQKEEESISFVTPSDSSINLEMKTLAIVEVSLDPPLSTPLTAGIDNEYYTFTGDYLGGAIKIKKAGTYHLTDNLVSNAGSGTSGTHQYAIRISGSDVILDGGYDSATGRIQNGITGNGVNYLDGILVTGTGVTIRNFGSITGFTGVASSGIRTEITADGVMISDSACTGNLYGILSYGSSATISGNNLAANVNDGVRSVGTNAMITGNTVTGNGGNGIRSIGDDATISDNTVTDNDNGISSGGVGAGITGNRLTNNSNGIVVTDTKDDLTVNSNYISANSGTGIRIDSGGGTGSGTIWDNYFANNVNVGGTGAPGTFGWSVDPVSGKNVMGGPTIAGNYWSNPTGTGWSDSQVLKPAGYTSSEDYEVMPGSHVYDYNPLVRHPAPIDIKSRTDSDNPVTPSLNSTDKKPFVHLVITNMTLPSHSSPGSATILTLQVKEDGTVSLPLGTPVFLVPVPPTSAIFRECSTSIGEGGYGVVQLPYVIPSEAGEYVYTFSSYFIQTDPLTNEEVRISSGTIIAFTTIIGADGSVNVVLT